jgi:hypothetical protein
MTDEYESPKTIIIQPDDLTIKIRDITVPDPVIQKEEKEDKENGQMV